MLFLVKGRRERKKKNLWTYLKKESKEVVTMVLDVLSPKNVGVIKLRANT